MQSLRLLAEKQNKSVTEVIKPHKEVLADMIPPKKHLLRHQPANAQIGLMDGNTFCTTLEPRLFTISKYCFYYLHVFARYCIISFQCTEAEIEL